MKKLKNMKIVVCRRETYYVDDKTVDIKQRTVDLFEISKEELKVLQKRRGKDGNPNF